MIADPKSQELLEILKRERSFTSPTTQDRINIRRNAEKVLGPDENVFRIDWVEFHSVPMYLFLDADLRISCLIPRL